MKDRSAELGLQALKNVDPATIDPPLTADEKQFFNEVREIAAKATKENQKVIIEIPFDG